jgi:hypothetical protein
VTGALLPSVSILTMPWLGPGSVLGVVVSFVFLLPGGGLALLITTLVNRAREDARALVTAVAALGIGIALLPVAGRVGMEAYVSSHMAEMDRLAAQLTARVEFERQHPEADRDVIANTPAGLRFQEMGLIPRPVAEGLLFHTGLPFAPEVLYAHELPGAAPALCAKPRLRYVGAHWYLSECSAPGVDDSD